MNLLPWLLRWPPRRSAVAVFLLVTVVSAGSVLLLGGGLLASSSGNVTVEETDLTVRLNDEQSLPESENGSVQTCLASGTPGDSISVIGTVGVDVPPDHRARSEGGLAVVVELVDVGETTSGSLDAAGGQYDVFWLLEDDETLSAGDSAELAIRVRSAGETVAAANESVVVEADSRNYDC